MAENRAKSYSAVSSFVLLLKGLDGATMESMIPMTLPLLAGVVLIEPHWTTALALAVLALGGLDRARHPDDHRFPTGLRETVQRGKAGPRRLGVRSTISLV